MGSMAMLHDDLKNLKHSITSTNLKCTGDVGGGSNYSHRYEISINSLSLETVYYETHDTTDKN